MTLEPEHHYTSKNKYVWGTSFAAPYASGVSGLIYMANPDLTAEEVKEILCTSAKEECIGYLNGQEYTYKMVNALEAVKIALGNNISEENNSNELTQYLGQNIYEVIKNFDNMKDQHVTSGDGDAVGYTNEIITFGSLKNDIAFIQIRGETPCTIEKYRCAGKCNCKPKIIWCSD